MIAAHQTMLAPQGAPLPYDAEVEYIQANGIAYIDTGVPFTTDYTARCKFQFMSGSSSNISPFGFYYNEQNAFRIYSRAGSSDWRYQNPTNNAVIFGPWSTFPFNGIYDVEIAPGYVKMGGATATTTTDSFLNQNYTQHLFGSRSVVARVGQDVHEMQTAGSIIRVYSASWTDGNGTLVRDFVPCRVGTEARIYDRVTGEFFAKQGAGTFTPGPDK